MIHHLKDGVILEKVANIASASISAAGQFISQFWVISLYLALSMPLHNTDNIIQSHQVEDQRIFIWSIGKSTST